MSLSKGSKVKQKVDKINSLWLAFFAEWLLDFYHAPGCLSPCIVTKYEA